MAARSKLVAITVAGLALAAVLVVLWPAARRNAATSRPNVLLITLDTVRAELTLAR